MTAGVQVTGHLSVFEHMTWELNSARILIIDDEEDIFLAAPSPAETRFRICSDFA